MTTEVFDFDGAGERFKFLLQPVKDLASNWDLNIAKTLEDYIQRVVEENDSAVLMDRNGRRRVFNFAEAALLIHGTTTVYVRKVEYVHQIALNFFDQLREDKNQHSGKKRQKGDINDRSTEQNGDEIDGGEGIVEGDNNEANEPGRRKDKQKSNKINHASMRTLLDRLSHRLAPSLPMVPIAFIPLSDFEKCEVPLFTRTNAKEQVGKKDDFRINSCHIYESVALLDLKNLSLVNKFTTFQRPNSLHDDHHRPTTGAGFHTLEPLMERSIEDELESMNLTSANAQTGEEQQCLNMVLAPADMNGGGGMFDGSDHFGSGAFDECDEGVGEKNVDRTLVAEGQTDANGPPPDIEGDIVPPTPPDDNYSAIVDGEIGREPQNSLAQTTANNLRGSQPTINDLLRPSTFLCNSRPITAMDELNDARREKEKQPDWEELLQDHLDPLEIVREQSKPYRKKQNCTTDAAKQIKARERRIERECREKGVPNGRSIKSYIDFQMFRRRLRKRNFAFGQFNSFLMDQAVLALNPLIYEEEKRRTDLRKKRHKEQQAAERAERARRRTSQKSLDPVLDHPNDEEEEEQAGGEAQQNGGHKGNGPDGDEEEEFEDGIEEIIAEEILPDMDDNATIGGGVDDDLQTNLGDILDVDDLQNSLGGIRNLYTGFEHLVSSKLRDPNTLASKLAQTMRNNYDDTILVDVDFNPDEIMNRPPSQMNYDEIIAYHLRRYWTESEAAMSKFSQRIQLWEAKMALALEEEQQHREFDTRQYGDELLGLFNGQIGNEVDFTQMLGTVSNGYDRSRFLLVSLILANMGNLEIRLGNDKAIGEEQSAGTSSSESRRQSAEEDVIGGGTMAAKFAEGMDQIRLKLLKLERHHQIFDEEQRLLTGNPLN